MVAKPNATIVIPTFNRAHMVGRAIETALAQTTACEVIVADHGSTDDTPDVVMGYGSDVIYLRRETDHGPFFCWLDGIVNARADYVHLTYDDDWIAGSFIEKCLDVLNSQCAYAFTVADIDSDEGAERHEHADWFATGIHDIAPLERKLLKMSLTPSPGCALFRKEEALRAINLAGVPLGANAYRGVGPDLMMFLMPLLRYSRFGFVNEPLAFFRAHSDSITVDAFGDAEKLKRLQASYDDTRQHYLVLRNAGRNGLGPRLLQGFRGRKRGPVRAAFRTLRQTLGSRKPSRASPETKS